MNSKQVKKALPQAAAFYPMTVHFLWRKVTLMCGEILVLWSGIIWLLFSKKCLLQPFSVAESGGFTLLSVRLGICTFHFCSYWQKRLTWKLLL